MNVWLLLLALIIGLARRYEYHAGWTASTSPCGKLWVAELHELFVACVLGGSARFRRCGQG